MKLSCAFVLTLTNLVIASPFNFSVKGSGTSAKAGATAGPGSLGLAHRIAPQAGGYSESSPTSPSVGFTSSSESSNFGALNYNSGHAYGSLKYIASGEVSHNVATVPQAVATVEAHTNTESSENIKLSGSYSSEKINDFNTNSVSQYQYQPTALQNKPSSLSGVDHLTSIGLNENSKPQVFFTYSKQPEEAGKFKEPSKVQSLPCQNFNGGSSFPPLSNSNKDTVLAEESPIYNGGFGGPSGILKVDNKETYISSTSFPPHQSTTESVKPLIQSLSNEYNKSTVEINVSAKPALNPTAEIKQFNDENTNKEQFLNSSPYEQVGYKKDKNTPLSFGTNIGPSTSKYSGEYLPANTFNASKPIQNFQIFVRPYYGNVLPSSNIGVPNKYTYGAPENPEKVKQTQEPTYTGGFGAPTGILKPFSHFQSDGHTFVSSGKHEQFETGKTNKVTTTNTNEIKVTGAPSTESTNYQAFENDSPAGSYVAQKPTSPIYDEQYRVSSESPILSTAKIDNNKYIQLAPKEVDESSRESEKQSFNPTVTSWEQNPTSSSSFSTEPVSNTIEKQTYVNSLDTKLAVTSSFDKPRPSYPSEYDVTEVVLDKTSTEQPRDENLSKNPSAWTNGFISSNKPFVPVVTSVSYVTSKPNSEILIPNIGLTESTFPPVTATTPSPASSWEQPTYYPPIKSSSVKNQPLISSENPKSSQSKYPIESSYILSKEKQESFSEFYGTGSYSSTPASATFISTFSSGKPQSIDFLLFTTPKPSTAPVNSASILTSAATSSTGFSSTSSGYSQSYKISSDNDNSFMEINAQSEKAQGIPFKVINNLAYPTANIASLGNTNPEQSQRPFSPNLPISSTNAESTSVESTFTTFAQQPSYKPSIEISSTSNSTPKVSENPKVFSTKNPSFIDYSSSTQKPNNLAYPGVDASSHFNSNSYYKEPQPQYSTASSSIPKVSENAGVFSSENPLFISYSPSTQKPINYANPNVNIGSLDNPNPEQSQRPFNPNLSISSTNVGSASVESTLTTFAQQPSYKPSIEISSTTSPLPKESENPKVFSTKNPSFIDYSSSTQKPNNLAYPGVSVSSHFNSNSYYKEPQPQSSTASSSIPKVSENAEVFSSENPSLIGYSPSSQKPINYANPNVNIGSLGNPNPEQSQRPFNPNFSISSTNAGSASVESTFTTLGQQPSYKPSIEISSTTSPLPKVSENPKVFSTKNPSFIDYSSSTQKPNNLAYPGVSASSHFNSNSYYKEPQPQPSTAPSVTNKPLYSNSFGTLTGAVKPSSYSNFNINTFPSSTSNYQYSSGLTPVTSYKIEQNKYSNQNKPSTFGDFIDKTTTLKPLYPAGSSYVSTDKPYVTSAPANTAQQSTELNQKTTKFSSSLDSTTIYPKLTQGPKEQSNNSEVSTASLVTSSSVKPTSPTTSSSSVFSTIGPVFGTGLSQIKPLYQYSTSQPANQNKEWYTNARVKPQSSYTYPGFISSFTNFGYGSSNVANKQFNQVAQTGQYKPYSIGQYNPTSTGQYVPSSTGYYNSISTGQYKPTSTGQYKPTSTGQYKPVSKGQYNPTLTEQYKHSYNWGFSKQSTTLKPFGQFITAGGQSIAANAPTSSNPLEKSKPNYNFSILNQKESSFTSGFASPSIYQTTPKPIAPAETTYAPVTEGHSSHSLEEYSEVQKITTIVSTTPKTNTQKPLFTGTHATTYEATNLSGNSAPVISQFFSATKPSVTSTSDVQLSNSPFNFLPSSVNTKEPSQKNNFGAESSISKSSTVPSLDNTHSNSFEKVSSTTPKPFGPIKATSSGNFVVQTASSLPARSEDTKNSQVTLTNYESQQTLNQNNLQLDSSLGTISPSQQTNSPKPSSLSFYTNFPSAQKTSTLNKSEHTSVSRESTVTLKPVKLSAGTAPNHLYTVSTENTSTIISESVDKAKEQVTTGNFQDNPTVFSNSFKPLKPAIPSANLHSSSSYQLPGSIFSSSNHPKDTTTVSLAAQTDNAGTISQKPLSQHSLVFNSETSRLSKPNIKVTVINQPSSSTVPSHYVGGFGGPSGILKPHDYSSPSVQANIPSQNNPIQHNQPTSNGNSDIQVTKDSKFASYSLGFGGPSGILKPDNYEKGTSSFYTGQDELSSNVQTSGFHGSLTSHNLSPNTPFVGTNANIKEQNVYGSLLPAKPIEAAVANLEGFTNNNEENYTTQHHSGFFHVSGNTKSTNSFSGQFGKINGLTTSASAKASAEAGTGSFGLKRTFTSGLAAAHGSSGLFANTGQGSKIF